MRLSTILRTTGRAWLRRGDTRGACKQAVSVGAFEQRRSGACWVLRAAGPSQPSASSFRHVASDLRAATVTVRSVAQLVLTVVLRVNLSVDTISSHTSSSASVSPLPGASLSYLSGTVYCRRTRGGERRVTPSTIETSPTGPSLGGAKAPRRSSPETHVCRWHRTHDTQEHTA